MTKVKTLTSKDNTILEKYRTKREKLNTSAAVSFGIITNYIAKKYSKEQFITKDIITLFRRESNNLIIDYPAYFTILEKEQVINNLYDKLKLIDNIKTNGTISK